MLSARFTADGSFSLHSDSFAESFHSSDGALEEANSKFVLPAQLDRFPDGMVDGLYLPDFQSIQVTDEQHDAVVDARLSRLHAEG